MKMKLNKGTDDMTKAAFAGLVLGTVWGMLANNVIMNQNCKIKNTASKALNTVGEAMQDISSRMQ